MGNTLQLDHVTGKETERGHVLDILQYAVSGMKGWRVSMEDSHTICTSLMVHNNIPLEQHFLFAVYDGHGGNLTSTYAGQHMVRVLTQRKELEAYARLPQAGQRSREDVNGVELLRAALEGAFHDLDDEIRDVQQSKNEQVLLQEEEEEEKKQAEEEAAAAAAAAVALEREETEQQQEPTREEQPPPSLELDSNTTTIPPAQRLAVERSGSTCIIVMITPSHILCANAGDSRAILKRGDRVLPLSFDHKPSHLPELERIIAAGGFVKSKRVDGDLAVSRGLGDFVFKGHPHLHPHQQKVVAKPDIMVYPRNEAHDQFVVLACDGVWDVLSNEKCGELIQMLLNEGESDLGLICEEILDMCLERNSRDNMTIVLVGLPAMRLPLPQHKTNAVLKRKSTRKARLLEIQAKMTAQTTAEKMGFDLGFAGPNNNNNNNKGGANAASSQSQKRNVATATPSMLTQQTLEHPGRQNTN